MNFELTNEAAYVAGFIIGDGNLAITRYLVRAVEENEEFADKFAEIFQKAFGKRPKIYFDKFNNSNVVYTHSKKIWEFLKNELEIPVGDKTRSAIIPSIIANAMVGIKSAFLSGIFDAEGSVVELKNKKWPNGRPQIQLKMHNPNFVMDLHKMLKDLGIDTRLYSYDDFALIYITGASHCKLFSEIAGFKHLVKNQKLRRFL